MTQPLGYYSLGPSASSSVVCRLKKALYGLKQSPRAWFSRFMSAMKCLAYRQSNGDHTLFYRHSTSGGAAILLVYVDDIIITKDDALALTQLASYLASKFSINHLGILRYFLGI